MNEIERVLDLTERCQWKLHEKGRENIRNQLNNIGVYRVKGGSEPLLVGRVRKAHRLKDGNIRCWISPILPISEEEQIGVWGDVTGVNGQLIYKISLKGLVLYKERECLK